MNEAPLGTKVRAMVRHWIDERERSIVRPSHPLETVHEMHLSEDGGKGNRIAASETRPSGRSRPPIRDMDAAANEVHDIMRSISRVDDGWSRALESVVEHGSLNAAVQSIGRKRSALYLDYLQGVAAFSMEMQRRGLG